jgi:hypothetical protein
MLPKHNNKSVSIPPRKIYNYLPPVEDVWDKGLRMYTVNACEFGQVYIGQSGRSIKIRIIEHSRHIRLAQAEISAASTRTILITSRIQKLLSVKIGHLDRLIRDVI